MANRVILGKSTTDDTDYGLFVSKPGKDVLDPDVGSGNLAFDSSDNSLGTLRIITQGSFSITCTKQNFGKKGQREILSDEQNSANSKYAQLYPWELDNLGDSIQDSDVIEQMKHKFSRRETKEALQSLQDNFFGAGSYQLSGGMGTIANPDNIANVYCDFGSKTLEFDPPLTGIKSPHVAVYFALANSTNHFHPWYANVVCTSGAEDYEWSYAVDSTGAQQSQQCVHMDSTWFRGKWSFRERVDTPLNQDIMDAVNPFEIYEEDIGDDGDDELNMSLGGVSVNGSEVGDPPASSGVWGGAFKCFAGLQGLAYYANNTHLTVDGFMSPTHTPTPFKRSTDYDVDDVDVYNLTSAQHNARGSGVSSPGYADTSIYESQGNGYGAEDMTDSELDFTGTDGTGDDGWWKKYDPLFHTRFANTTLGEYQVDHLNIEYMDGSKTKIKLYKEGSLAPDSLGTEWYDDHGSAAATDWMDEDHKADQNTYIWATPGGVSPRLWLQKPLGSSLNKKSGRYLDLAETYKNIAQKTILKNFGPHPARTDQDRFLHTHTLQGQPTGLDSFWNSFSNNMSQYVNANTPYGEMQYSSGQYGIVWDHSGAPYRGNFSPSQGHYKASESGGTAKLGIGTEGPRFGFGGAGSKESIGNSGGFDTYIVKYIVYDLEGGDSDV